MARRRILIAVVVLLAAGGLAFLALRTEPRIIILPDGRTVEFLGTTVGQQTFSTELPWHKLARRILPSRFQTWLPAVSRASCSSGTNSITVFFRVTDLTGALIQGTPWQGYQAEDNAGFLYNRDGGNCSFGGGTSSRIYGLSLKAYPRREPTFRFHFLDGKDAVIGTFIIPNPATRPFENWTPQPLPQTATNGPLVITAERLERHGSGRWQSAGARWKVESTVPHWKRARVRSSTLLDATGNDAQWLSPREPAWKVRTTFHRERDDDYQPEERWRLDNITVPAKGQFIALDQTTNILGVTIVARVVSPPGTFYITNGIHRALDTNRIENGSSSYSGAGVEVKSWGVDKPFVMVEAHDREDGDEVRLRMLDESGRELGDSRNETSNETDSTGITRYVKRFVIPPETKSLSLEVIINRPLVFEFMVNPKDLPPPKPNEPR